jgi:membrane protein YqaA with SNARE-associated domain
MTLEHRTALLRVLSLLAVVAISVWIFSIRDKASELAAYGYPGIFIISLLANATVLLPAPGVAVVFAMGGVFDPLFVGIVAGVGSALGELSGYLAGFSGQAVAENSHIYNRIKPWVEHYGAATIFVLSAIPNPFFDLAGIAAGILKMPVRIFLFWCILGKILKMLAFAYAGAYSIDWLFRLMK